MEENCSLRGWGSEGEEEEAKGEERKVKAIQLVPIKHPLLAYAWTTPLLAALGTAPAASAQPGSTS